VIILKFQKGDHKQCTNYRGISLLSLPGKMHAKCLEKWHCEIVESKSRKDSAVFIQAAAPQIRSSL